MNLAQATTPRDFADGSLHAGPRGRLPRRLWSWLFAWALVAMASCGEEITDYDSLYLAITSDATPEPVQRLDFDLRNAAGQRLTSDSGDGKFQVALPAGFNIATKAFRVQIKPNATWSGKLQLRVLGRDKAGTVRSAFNGVIDSAAKKEQAIQLALIGGKPDCDGDGDGVPTCAKAECFAVGSACDCNDDPAKGGATASPFLIEDACQDAGNGIDEDCDGTDAAAVDTDNDTDPDCVEQQKCPTVGGVPPEKNPAISRKAAEICDDVDNDCNGKADDGLVFTDIDGTVKSLGKGDVCGQGVCAGGSVTCSSDKKGLSCSSAAKKVAEICGNKLDDDCNGQADEGCEADDLDGDGVSNKDEAACKFKFARFHSEYRPGAKEPCCQGGKDCTGKDGLYDFNCDGTVTACPASDPDGDGKTGELDCEPNNPDVYSGAKQQCGDKKGPCPIDGDVPCTTDKDGDKWDSDVDCDDGNKDVRPGAEEICNGRDDDCDGLVDEGNPGGADEVCGDGDGDCGLVKGVQVCKHFVAKDAGFKPGDLDCLKQPYAALGDGKLGVCVGCFGDQRPQKETCDEHDQDCDGQTDEDFPYGEEGTGKTLKWGEPCDGVGACGKGQVQCENAGKAICSTDPKGKQDQSKVETCNNVDDNCNGSTDEALTLVSDSKCQKVGVCGAGQSKIQTVCVAGTWRCDYALVPSTEYNKNQTCKAGEPSCQCEGIAPTQSPTCYSMTESSCDGLDNDCDGSADEDFAFKDFDGKLLKITQGCGTGACASGKVVCAGGSNATGTLTCDTLTKVSGEKCNSVDDDCDGATDELKEMPVTDSTCSLKGVCTAANVIATCPGGKWLCDYNKVTGYETGKEISCDGLDNDCDGQTDEDFDYKDFDGKLIKVGLTCGTGVCAQGQAVCTADKKGLTCSTLGNIVKEACDGKDNDCDGQADEDFQYTEEGGAKLGIGMACNGIGECGAGAVECTKGKTDQATCSTDANGSAHVSVAEKCNDKDDDCDSQTDEACDQDKDAFCTAAMATEGKPKSCPKGGGDCEDDPTKNKDAGLINPGASELCDSVDNNCSAATDEIFKYSEPTGVSLGVGQACGLGACSAAGAKVTCGQDKVSANCPGYQPQTEICDNADNDCDGQTDEGCDDDGDKYCDSTMKVAGVPTVCNLTKVAKDGDPGNDCNDDPAAKGAAQNPGQVEVCNNVDDNCANSFDEGCDDDGDKYCDAAMVLAGASSVCPSGGGDCNDKDAAVKPSATEICDDIDNNCAKGKDEGCDDDGDQFCDAGMLVAFVGAKPLVCLKGWGDCNDNPALGGNQIYPGASEICDDIDNNCATGTDEGCDDDGDQYCDKAIAIVGTPKICPKGGNDCDDVAATGGSLVNPAAKEACDTKDNNCNGSADEGCDDDGDKYCDANMVVVGKPFICPNSANNKGDDCDDNNIKVNPSATEICDDVDNNCSGPIDEGCDDDKDTYCDANLLVIGSPKVCISTKGGSTATQGNDCNDDPTKGGFSVNPGKTESCASAGIDDNCDGKVDDEGAQNCTNLYADADTDGYGAGQAKCLCKPGDVATYTAVVAGDCNDKVVGGSTIHPGAKEVCSTADDDNCSGGTNDENANGCTDFYYDGDQDSWGTAAKKCLCVADTSSKYSATKTGDCLDDPSNGKPFNPGVQENCDTVVDDNCNGTSNDVDGKACKLFYNDADGDGVGAGTGTCVCKADAALKYVTTTNNDCDDNPSTGKSIYPGNKETCATAYDDNCDLATNEENATSCKDFYLDTDLDTWGTSAKKCLCEAEPVTKYTATKSGDCNDLASSGGALVNPGVTEICNDLDENCGGTDEGCDDDADKYCDSTMSVASTPGRKVCNKTTPVNGKGDDCNDASSGGAAFFPGADELCNNKDDNCNGQTDDAVSTSLWKPATDCNTALNGKGVCTETAVKAVASCAAGTWTCNYAAITAYLPTEVSNTSCDGKDNDCNGTADDGCP